MVHPSRARGIHDEDANISRHGMSSKISNAISQLQEKQKTPVEPAEILSYYFRVRVGKRPLNERYSSYWLVLWASGKTSLVNCAVRNSFNKARRRRKEFK